MLKEVLWGVFYSCPWHDMAGSHSLPGGMVFSGSRQPVLPSCSIHLILLCLKFNWPFVPSHSEWAQASSTTNQPSVLIPLYLICPAESSAFITYPNIHDTPPPPFLHSSTASSSFISVLVSLLDGGQVHFRRWRWYILQSGGNSFFPPSPPRVLDRYSDWLLFVPARLVLNTALFLLSSPSEDFFFWLCKSAEVASLSLRAEEHCDCRDRDLPIIWKLWDWQIDPNGLSQLLITS